MKIITIDGCIAQCEANGVRREVSLFMLQNEALSVNDFVMVHVGYAIQKVTEQAARTSWELFDEMLNDQVKDNA